MHNVIPADSRIPGGSRPEAMADVPGVCEVPLTRAVVQYRDIHEIDHPGGRIQDIGIAVVIEGRFASSARVIDLGSADIKYLDLSSELVVLDWIYDPTLSHIRFLANAIEDSPETRIELGRYCFEIAVRILNRTGFTPLTRASLLRIGFRDLCKDLDLHEGTVVRINTGAGHLTRVHMDYDACALVFRSSAPKSDPALEAALGEVYPDLDRRRLKDADGGSRESQTAYEVRFGVPLSFEEARKGLLKIRLGLNHLIARFEPDRFQAVHGLVKTFGARETLDQLVIHEARVAASVALAGSVTNAGLAAIH